MGKRQIKQQTVIGLTMRLEVLEIPCKQHNRRRKKLCGLLYRFEQRWFCLGWRQQVDLMQLARHLCRLELESKRRGSSNTDGSITSTVSANPSAGFSIVTYTGMEQQRTVGHGLGVAPQW
jgi:hypothetical protein